MALMKVLMCAYVCGCVSRIIVAYTDDRSVRVHGDVVRGIFTGQIRTAEDIYFIEPSSRLDVKHWIK